MISGGKNDNVARQLIELHQKERYDPFNLTSFMSITTLFAYCVKLIKEQNARLRSYIVKQPAQPSVRLSEITSN